MPPHDVVINASVVFECTGLPQNPTPGEVYLGVQKIVDYPEATSQANLYKNPNGETTTVTIRCH